MAEGFAEAFGDSVGLRQGATWDWHAPVLQLMMLASKEFRTTIETYLIISEHI